MGGLERLIDSVGGLDIKPLLTFTYDNQSFVKDEETHMDGARALAYVRMRYTDPRGDYGRQARQRQVLTQLAFKGSHLTSLINQKFLSTISKQMVTDLAFDDLLVLGANTGLRPTTWLRITLPDNRTRKTANRSKFRLPRNDSESPTFCEKRLV